MTDIGNYTVTKKIAEGGFGKIYQAKHVLLNEVACIKKTLEPTPDYGDLLRLEARILWRLCEHHSIPHAKDFFVLKDGNHAMVMSYIDGLALDKFIPPNSRLHPEDATWITQRLLEALFYCHFNGVIHGDVKPANILIEPKKHDVKVIDFGLATYKPTSTGRPPGMTLAFAAPEILQNKPPIPETDIYGAGIVMLYALGGDLKSKTFPADVPEPLQEFCNSMLRYDPMERPNWESGRLLENLLEIRKKVFGRKHTAYYSKTKIDP